MVQSCALPLLQTCSGLRMELTGEPLPPPLQVAFHGAPFPGRAAVEVEYGSSTRVHSMVSTPSSSSSQYFLWPASACVVMQLSEPAMISIACCSLEWYKSGQRRCVNFKTVATILRLARKPRKHKTARKEP